MDLLSLIKVAHHRGYQAGGVGRILPPMNAHYSDVLEDEVTPYTEDYAGNT